MLKRENIFFEYLEQFNQRMSVKSASLKPLELVHVRSKFSSLFKKLLSNHFQEDKELGSWFGSLLPIISLMDNCQP